MKARWKFLIAAGICMALATIVSFMTMRVQPESQVAAYKKLLLDRGEKLELSEVWPTPVPAASNSAAAVVDAFRRFSTGNEKIPAAMKLVAPGKALIGWRQPDARNTDFTNSWEDFSDEVAANRPAIHLLHQVLERPTLDFEMDYKKGAMLPLPHLALLKRAAQMLNAAAVCDLHNGDPAATTNILILLGLVQRNTAEGLLISHLVRMAMTAIAVSPTWELLQATNITDAQLATLQKSWEQMDFLSDAQNAFVTERAWGADIIQKCRASHGAYAGAFGLVSSMGSSGSSSGGVWDWEAMTEKPRDAIGEAMWRSSWSYTDELRSLKSATIILETLRRMQTNASQSYKTDYDTMKARVSTLGITNFGEAFFRTLKIPYVSGVFGDSGLSSAVGKTIRLEAARRVVVAAIALKRFQLKHDQLPEALGKLAPEYFPSVPIDPYDGKPLRYHPNADGTFLLYCVGEDGVDDGGDPSLPAGVSSTSFYWQNNHARDWVWPQPATDAEIKHFYEPPPK